ncbi:MAG: Maf family protein [Lachnospiraceae bacterium]
MAKKRIILASASPRRKMLLEQIGFELEIVPSEIEERITGKESPEELVRFLSAQKALDVAGRQTKGSIVLGSDTVVAIQGKILGKPTSPEDAARMLSLLQGNTHQVYTGVTLAAAGTRSFITFSEKTEVTVFPMTENEIMAYVESGDPMDKAGAYGIQGPFAAYIQGIHGDYNNVVGLPVGRVYQEWKKWLGGSND